MSLIAFRHLPAVALVEEQLRLQSLGLLSDDEADELAHLIDDASRDLFGITANDTMYAALPEAVRANYGRAEWEANFAILGEHPGDTHKHWRASGLDFCCEEGCSLHCLEVFARQLICALDGLQPQAVLTFVESDVAQAA